MWNEKWDILASMLENVHKNESTLQKNPPSGNLSSWIWPGGKLFLLYEYNLYFLKTQNSYKYMVEMLIWAHCFFFV